LLCRVLIPFLLTTYTPTERKDTPEPLCHHVSLYCEGYPRPRRVVAPHFHILDDLTLSAGGRYLYQNAAFLPRLQTAWTSHRCNASSGAGYSLYRQVVSACVGKVKRKLELFALVYLSKIMLLSFKVNGRFAISQGRQKHDYQKNHLLHKQSISRWSVFRWVLLLSVNRDNMVRHEKRGGGS
jgi:hypothetical protein